MSESHSIRDICLVPYAAPSFIEWSQRMKRIFSDSRPHDPYMADYQRILLSLEEQVRQLLSRHICLGAERVLRYRAIASNGSESLEFRELDAVTVAANAPACAIEIKFRERGRTACRGFGQLGRSSAILRQRWPAMNDIFLSFWMAPIFGLDDRPPAWLHDFSEVLSFAHRPAAAASATFCVDGTTLLNEATIAGLWTPAQTAELVALRGAAIRPLSTLDRIADNDGLNSLGRLFGENPAPKASG